MAHGLRQEVTAFLDKRQAWASHARQAAALQIACHLDLAAALDASPAERERIILSLERAIERERLRGMRRHWSYDLNRHIALKQALDSLSARNGSSGHGRSHQTQNDNGARRRRRRQC